MITASLSNLNFRTYRYSFQGQEKDDEVAGASNSINYTYRMHDVRVGRFFAVDPLAGKYPMLSSYQFSSNNPIGMIEIEGLEGMALVNKEKDKYAYASSYLEFDKSAIHIFIHGSPAGIT
ncbi:MAG: hypothetical protein JNJ99_02025, partial [Crocinitomicaceae bacterium]|nr:hypothetical protein [Crocinitomicaceae bacterium]